VLDNATTAARGRSLLPTGPGVTTVTSRHRLPGPTMDCGHTLFLHPLDDAA
jgi:hypothetical protein